MSNKLYSEESIQAIANSIRAKNGTSETYTVSEMSTAISALPTNLTTKTITANGTYNASSDDVDGFNEVTVAVQGYAKKSILNTPTAIATFNASALPMPSLKVEANGNHATAYSLNSGSVMSDTTPYLYRASHSGSAVEEEIVGATVAWNQLVNTTDTSCTVPNGHKYIFHHGTTYDVAVSDGNAFTVDGSANDNVHDITQALGTAIADNVYTLEQATEGSGIAWLKSYGFLTKDYYAYQSGSLQSVNVASRKVYDSNNVLKATYPLDSNLTLRGIPKLDSNNNLYYDGDTYESDGSVKRKMKQFKIDNDLVVTMFDHGSQNSIFWISFDNNNLPQGVANTIMSSSGNISASNTANTISISIANNLISPENATGFKNWAINNNIEFVYELATPTTESATPYTNPQQVFSGGTEEFVDAGVVAQTRDVEIPVGQNSKYVDGEIYITYFKDNGQSMDVQDGVIDMVSGVLTVNNVDYQQERQPIWTKSGNNTFTASGDIQSGEYMEAL